MQEMNSFERVMAVLQGHMPDCVPVCPTLLMHGAAELGLDLETYFTQGQHLAEGQMRLWEKYGHDCVFGIPHVVQDVTAFGAELIYFHNGPPSVRGMVIQDLAQVERLNVPDPTRAPLLVETLKAIERLAGELKGQVPVLGACIAPFSLPSMLMGAERWMELLFIQAPAIRQQVLPSLLEITCEFCVAWANAQLAAGADAVILADGMASASVINRQQFIDLALPWVKRAVSGIKGAVIHEGVGDLHPMLDLLLDTGVVAAILSCRDDLGASKALVQGKIALIGNLNNVAMRRWTVKEMVDQAQAALAAGAPGGGYILAPQGPEIPLGVAEEVIHAMVRTAHDWRTQ